MRLPLLAASAALALCAVPAPARAQLRPLDPMEWRMFRPERSAEVEVGGSALGHQRAALAGTEGPLYEAGNIRAFWHTGRVVFEGAGTVQRFFRDDWRFRAPEENVVPQGSDWRHDSGDYRASSAVRLTPERFPALAILRFGTRLPTTNNRVGLDRDATDFFALAGARVERGAGALSAETGVTINGTRNPGFEQSDKWVYIVRGEYFLGPVLSTLTFTGEMDGMKDRSIRGNEDLGEARLGLRTGVRRWVRAELVAGYTTYSPDLGVIVAAGVVW